MSFTRKWFGVACGATAACLAIALAGAVPALAGTIEVRLISATRVELDAKDGSVDEILKQLGTAGSIAIERIGEAQAPRTWSGYVVGRLDDVLARVLESENFVVEHAASAKSGIARVRVFAATDPDDGDGPRQTAVLTPPPQPPPASTPARATPPPVPRSTATVPPSPLPGPSVRSRSGRQQPVASPPLTQAGAKVRGGMVQ